MPFRLYTYEHAGRKVICRTEHHGDPFFRALYERNWFDDGEVILVCSCGRLRHFSLIIMTPSQCVVSEGVVFVRSYVEDL